MFTGFMISLLFMVAQINLAPYYTPALNTTQGTSLLANTLTLFVGLMLIIDLSMEEAAKLSGESFDPVGRNVVAVLIVMVNLSVLAVPPAISAMQSSIFLKALRLLGLKADKLDEEDSEHTGRGVDPEQTVTPFPPEQTGGPLPLLPLPIRVSTDKNNFVPDSSIQEGHVMCSTDNLESIKLNASLDNQNETPIPVAEIANIQSIINMETVFNPMDSSKTHKRFDTKLCFAFYQGSSHYGEEQSIDSGQITGHEEPLLLNAAKGPAMQSFLDIKADVTGIHSQIPVLSDDKEQVVTPHSTSMPLGPEILFQQAINEAQRMAAEGYAELQDIHKNGEKFF